MAIKKIKHSPWVQNKDLITHDDLRLADAIRVKHNNYHCILTTSHAVYVADQFIIGMIRSARRG